ncbi:SWI5-dependent HO expression protein 3 [Drosophila busckii]|uniref:SWI5-dependent HO expression protein 3 n=1 Tax=Drosophila busckii TaxID=30019 RepID=UPI0014329961|nr:SWI5-dependent HO expression protein 3 [Drosophila busckii]
MEKTPRYTQRERNMVLGYAAQYKDVIENKRTDAESNRKKDEVWLQIAKEFNGKVYHQRSAKQLRQLYKNMKLLLKKDLCGDDKGNRSFMDLLNTLSQQDSVAQYIAEQMSPDGAGTGSQVALNGRHLGDDDYEDSKPHVYEGMDTDIILIKSETISDNEQTENGMDCMDDDDDDDCPSPKAPEVCLEEEDEVLYATDRRQQSLPSINSSNLASDPLPRAASSPVCSNKTSSSSGGSYMSMPKADITLTTVGNIRVGAFANINKTLQNGAVSSSNSNNNNNNNSSSSNNSNGSLAIPLTAEQLQQHMLLNGLGLSAVQHAPALQASSSGNNNNNNNNNSSSSNNTRLGTPTLQLPRLQRAQQAAATNGSNSAAAAVPLLLSLQQSRDKLQQQHTHASMPTVNLNGYNGYNNNNNNNSSNNNNNNNNNSSSSSSSSHNNSSHNNNNHNNNSSSSSRGQHNEYMMTLAVEERKRKIELLNAQIEYWQTLTKKLDAQSGHYPNPACLCHFPGSNVLNAGVNVSAAAASNVSAVNAMQTQSSSS